MAKKDEQKAEGEAAVVETADSPLLDLTDAAVKRMIKIAKKRGWVTHEELNAVLPSEEISSDQIEDMNSMLNEMGINVVDNEDAEEAEKESTEGSEEDESEGGEVAETARPFADVGVVPDRERAIIEQVVKQPDQQAQRDRPDAGHDADDQREQA